MSLTLAAVSSFAAVATPPPPPLPAERPPMIVVYQPGVARCGGRVEQPRAIEQPIPDVLTYMPPNMTSGPLRLRFRISADGRPLSIAQPEGSAFLVGNARDLLPAFAAWQFAPGSERRDCEISFEAEIVPIASATERDVQRLLVLGRPPAEHQRAGRRRIDPEGATCHGLRPRLQAYPAFEEIPQRAGTLSFSMTAFDIDARGRPQRVRIIGSSGNEELDRRALEAIRASRYAPDALTGCTYPYWRRSDEKLAPPPPPEADSMRPAGSACRSEDVNWRTLPPLVFPSEYARRGIEGWALVGYDLAPWGATGNQRVITAEPSARFGEQALAIVRAARARIGTPAATGCVDRVIFRLPERGEQPEPAAG